MASERAMQRSIYSAARHSFGGQASRCSFELHLKLVEVVVLFCSVLLVVVCSPPQSTNGVLRMSV